MGTYQKSDVESWVFKPKKHLNLVTRNSKSTEYVASLGKQRNPKNNLCSEFYPFQHPGHWTLPFSFVVMISTLIFVSPETQYFITLFNKISWLCGQQPGGDEASNEGCNSGPTGHDFRYNSNIHVHHNWLISQTTPKKNIFSIELGILILKCKTHV